MLFNIPISPAKVDQLIDVLDLSPPDRVLDVGCGIGEFLLQTTKQTACRGLGVDQDATAISTARSTANKRGLSEDCGFEVKDAQNAQFEPEAFAAAICLGSPHAFGMGDVAYPDTLRELTRVIKPGGRLLIGEGYWKQDPSSEYLEMIVEPVGIYRDHSGNVTFAEAEGLIPLYAMTRNDDEWDHFEWSHRRRIEAEFAANPDNADLQTRVRHSRAWRDGYLKWGRATMGFGFYIFQKSARVSSMRCMKLCFYVEIEFECFA